MVLNNNALVPQAVIPLDPSLTELLAQASAATATSAAVAEATTPVDDNGEEPASASESLDADDADATPAPRRKVKGKSRKAARAAKAAEANDDADNDSAVEPSNEPQDDDVPSSADAADTGTSRKSRVAAKAKGSKKGSKKSKAKDVPQDDEDAESALDSKASAAAGDLPEDTAAADLETQSGYKRIGSARQRSAHGSLRDEAAQARAEAAADARAAVLSEIRADASAEAAREASSELHIDGASIIRDEEASANRIRDAYETPRGYLRDGTDSAYSYDYTHPRSSEDEGANSSTVERYASPEYENTSTWDVAHAASWAGAHSNSYEEPHTMYHPYGSEDSYDRASYGQGDKDTSYGEYKSHYSDASPTADSVVEGSSSYSENGYPHSYSDNSDQSYGGEHEYNSQSKPFNFVNLHADSAFARDAASAAPLLSASASTLADGPHAVNDLDPLSYATQSCVMRNGLPLSASADNHPSGQSSIMVIGIPQGSAPATSVAPLASTVMVTKVITPAVKVIYASSTSASA
ncbi:hypothetical protein H4S01_003224 [Coemansia sp. RSA 2610]|nr:hypothetical protein H4S01_003224 [Coemansia sp. RSA 2610]